MLRVVGCITQHHDLVLVLQGFIFCLLATITTVRLLGSSPTSKPRQSRVRLGAAVLAFGTGVWTTHFICILAFRPGVPVALDIPLCVLSFVLSLIGAAAAFSLHVGATDRKDLCVASGSVLAAGIASMHYVGMAALILPGTMRYDIDLMSLSIGLGGLCSIAAVRLLSNNSAKLAMVSLTFAVLIIHFGGMGSVTLEVAGNGLASDSGPMGNGLAIAVCGTCAVIIGLTVTASVIDQHLTNRLARENRRFRALADATFEGLVFERSGQIIDVNRAMCHLAETEAVRLIGLQLIDLLPGITLEPPPSDRAIEHVVLLPDGNTRPVEVLWRNDPEREGHVVAIRDLSRQKAAESQIEQLARFDPLTGLANRSQFEQQVKKAISLHERGGVGFALLHIDLDRFDTVNEALGPWAGEQVLIQVARRLASVAKEVDTVARLGRDEFAIVQLLAPQPDDATALAERIVARMAAPFSVDGQPLTLTASIGIARYPADCTEAAELVRQAVLALRQAKLHCRGRWLCFEPGMDSSLQAKRRLERDLQVALNEGQFSLNYQPFVAMPARQIAGYEALLRWDHPERGRIPPSEFIAISEESGLIVPIGSWVLATACAEAVSWQQPLTISVNLSPAQFVQPGIVATVADVLQRTGLPAARLELEITESTLMDDTQNALQILTALKALGVKIAMDDFGTGYSSLSYLRKFPFDKIKIDRSFISDVDDDAEAETIVQAIIAMSRSLRLDITAEGVETEGQFAMLSALGCTYAQGYLLGRPRPADQLEPQPRTASMSGEHPAVVLRELPVIVPVT